ncbi:MAG TPA: hypothetical protein VMK83_00075 [Gaiellaceae bacterium]|nr:hypothetical protein [Gaiellaceae bacterium]
MSALEQAGYGATPEYRHAPKVASPQPGITLGEAVLKWYDIAPEDASLPLAIRALARRCLRSGARAGTLELDDALGFVVLHRCDGDFYFLLVSTWRNDNELWETVWAKSGAHDVLFHPVTSAGSHRPTFCVWELGAVAHEREAWIRYLRSERDDSARRAYLRDSFCGAV